MESRRTIDVQQVIDRSPVSSLQITLILLCFFVVAIDGFDTASIGFIAPAIRATWALKPAQLAPLFGSGLFGLMLGALAVGPFADRKGRKVALSLSIAVFGVASLLSASSTSLHMLIVFRFVTGCGLGGAMPNAITLTSEYCPAAKRSSLVTLMFCGFTIGSALGGIASAQLLPHHGWRSVLVVGGVLPLVLLPLVLLFLPESLRFLVMRGDRKAQVARLLQRIAPAEDFDGANLLEAQVAGKRSVWVLFRPELLEGTLFLWFTFFMSLLVVYLLSNWLPTLIHDAGISLSRAAMITAMLQVGGTIGAIVIGQWMDRVSPYAVLGAGYFLAAISVLTIGRVQPGSWMLTAAVFFAGFFVSGSQVGGNALSAAYYPTPSRATGVSWANAMGRAGSIVGSMAGGILLSMKLTLASIFTLAAGPALLASLAIIMMGVRMSQCGERQDSLATRHQA